MILEKEYLKLKEQRLTNYTKWLQYPPELIVIGGGITGAGIALDASLRGISTLLIEKNDFASGTSSKSTKLIHGGLRYLKQLEFGLVKETGLERAVTHRNIPHLIHPEKMLLPISKDGTFNFWSASLAIGLYDWLAKVLKKDRKRSFNKKKTLQKEPLLNKRLVQSSVQYSEYRTDDARLTIEIIKSAQNEGAHTLNYATFQGFLYEKDQIIGIQIKDLLLDKIFEIHAQQIVSAAGPWVDELRTQDQSLNDKSLHLTKGVHIVVPHQKLPLSSAVYFDDFDGRMIFAIPRADITYVGTTDTNYTGDKNQVTCDVQDAEYLIHACNTMFDVPTLDKKDIISHWAGLRPLIHEKGKGPSELSRKDEIFESPSGLISIAGGKLTGYRKMARRVIKKVQKKHPSLSQAKGKTRRYKLHKKPFKNYASFLDFKQQLINTYPSICSKTIHHLCDTYGATAQSILQNSQESKYEKNEHKLIDAELSHCFENEMVIYPEDYFIRRSSRLYFDIFFMQTNLNFVIELFSKHFNWSEQTAKKQKDKCLADLAEGLKFKQV